MSPTGPQKLPRVLLIDDDPISREVLSMMLEMHGFSVDSAEGGREAIKFLSEAQEQPELILMDSQMPGLSGVKLIKALRLRSDARARIVAISGSEVNEEMQRATDGFLLKPIEMDALLALYQTPGKAPAAEQEPPRHEETLASLMAEADSTDLINAAVLGKLKAMMPASAVREVYAAVAADLATRLPLLQTAMHAGDAREVSRIAHTIKGGCAMVGISIAIEAAATLEKSNEREAWPKQLSQLHFAMNE